MKRNIGESMCFTGGAEHTPRVTVTRYNDPGSLHHGDKTLMIADTQTGQGVCLSPQTIKEILRWVDAE